MQSGIKQEEVRDRRILVAASFLRSIATGMIGVVIGLYLVQLKYSTEEIGIVVTAGLSGATFAVMLVTFGGNFIKTRTALLCLATTSAIFGLALAFTFNFVPVAAAAFFGMLNGMGRDRGASLVLEQATLPSTTTANQRTLVFAWYNIAQDVGHALGALLAVLPTVFRRFLEVDPLDSFRFTIFVYAGLMLVSAVLYLLLSPAVDVIPTSIAKVSAKTKKVLFKISGLFALDSLGGGFLTAALVSVFFWQRFHVSAEVLGALYFGARIANALSHLAAAWLAKQIGLVNTMVFTHAPSSLLLLTVAFAPTFPIAAALFLLREGLVEMDVPTRQSYVMAVVEPDERTAASGITHLVRLGAWAIAPVFGGFLMQSVSPGAPLIVASGLKLTYDGLLYFAFRNVRPPEERSS
jgi:MFS family permease